MRRLALCLLSLWSPFALAAPPKAAPTPEPLPAGRMEGLSFRCIGPSRGGRVVAVAGVRGKPLVSYFGGTGGGVWKTSDGGSSWEPMSDKDLRTGSVGAIAVAESDPNVVYAGMGEGPIRGNTSAGDGVYRSTDAGRSWTNVGLRSAGQISRVRVHPKDPDLVYVAAQGHAFGLNEERGIYRSSDGGRAWRRVLYVDERTGASDLVLDPTNPRILFAGFWQVIRRPWTFESGGPGSGLYRSTDGGDTWKRLTEGLPEGILGKIGVAVSPARPERVWAMVEAEKGGLFRSDDGGEKWTRVNDENKLRQRAWYYSTLYADPRSADTVYVLNVGMHRSIDGGKTFAPVATNHGDHHDLWIDPDDPAHLIVGDDGGAAVSFSGGKTWTTLENQPTGQFYRVATDERTPYRVYGAQQDNSTVSIPSRVPGSRIDREDWYAVGGCESGWVAPSPKDREVVYAGCYGGSIQRYDHRTETVREIVAWPQLAIGQAPKDLRYRFQWNAPILASRLEPGTLYHAAQVLLRTRDEGETWEEVSPDLTRNDRSKQEGSGGPITRDNTSVETFGTIFALAESRHEPGVLWAGTDDGLVHVTRDGARTWQNVTPKGLPDWIQINSIEASPHEKGGAYVATTMYKHDDPRPYLYRTTDYGVTWTKIVDGIPSTAFTRVVRADPSRRGLLFAGTETGLYLSFDDGARWEPFQLNLPAVPITDLAIKDGDLVVATQGRAFWILDDLSPLRQWKPEIAKGGLFLFPPGPAIRFDSGGGGGEGRAAAGAAGRNGPPGAVLTYWIDRKPKEKERLTIGILKGDEVLRAFSSEKRDDAEKKKDDDAEKPLEPAEGLNRFVWDLRMLNPSLVPNAIVWGSKRGPYVAPGTYTVRVRLGDRTATADLQVLPHPGLGVPPKDLERQAALLAKIRDRITETHQAVVRIRDVKGQVEALVERAGKIGKAETLAAPAKALKEKLSAVEEKLVNPKIKAEQDVLNFPPQLDHQFVGLGSMVGSTAAAPTKAAYAFYDEAEKKLRSVLGELDAALGKDLADFNRLVREKEIPPVIAPLAAAAPSGEKK